MYKRWNQGSMPGARAADHQINPYVMDRTEELILYLQLLKLKKQRISPGAVVKKHLILPIVTELTLVYKLV